VQAKGFASQTAKVDLLDATNVANFTLSQGNIFRGQVVDEAGNPIPNAVVQTDYDFKNRIEKRFEWTAHTDVTGWLNGIRPRHRKFATGLKRPVAREFGVCRSRPMAATTKSRSKAVRRND
jgi:hypothetical protein